MPNPAMIQQRIAAIIWQHLLVQQPPQCLCGDWNPAMQTWNEHVAEVLVAELGLTRFELDNGAEYWYSTTIWSDDA